MDVQKLKIYPSHVRRQAVCTLWDDDAPTQGAYSCGILPDSIDLLIKSPFVLKTPTSFRNSISNSNSLPKCSVRFPERIFFLIFPKVILN